VGLSKTQSGYDSIWVIVDRLTKVAQSRRVVYVRDSLFAWGA
jgi:hypothetical protein